jgi:hypothetical protein
MSARGRIEALLDLLSWGGSSGLSLELDHAVLDEESDVTGFVARRRG